jgi:hypothetical protein
LDACFDSITELLIACRIILADFFQAFGVPEVEQISAEGRLRERYFRNDVQPELRSWAERVGASVVETTVEDEIAEGRNA